MPMQAPRQLRPVEEERSFLHKVVGDFVTRVEKAPVGTVAFTGLNLLSSLIPSASFLISDALIARAVQHYLDPNFKLMYDDEKKTRVNEESMQKLLGKMLDMGTGSAQEQARARKAMETLRNHAKLNGWEMSSPLQAQLTLKKEFNVRAGPQHFSDAAKFIAHEPRGVQKSLHFVNLYLKNSGHHQRVAFEKARAFFAGNRNHPSAKRFQKLAENKQTVVSLLKWKGKKLKPEH
ncbi:hypothetical protein HZC09_00510 [Candidatus Micrarchaeota archaeon]|nr:hypothetical protein [Candidatus Micrarchaeota archaeon]